MTMANTEDLKDISKAVEAARSGVARAQAAYSRGGSPDALNKANRALADCYARSREIFDGRPHDDR
jgi:hypothetical protein